MEASCGVTEKAQLRLAISSLMRKHTQAGEVHASKHTLGSTHAGWGLPGRMKAMP